MSRREAAHPMEADEHTAQNWDNGIRLFTGVATTLISLWSPTAPPRTLLP
jgi:hypothetical protein